MIHTWWAGLLVSSWISATAFSPGGEHGVYDGTWGFAELSVHRDSSLPIFAVWESGYAAWSELEDGGGAIRTCSIGVELAQEVLREVAEAAHAVPARTVSAHPGPSLVTLRLRSGGTSVVRTRAPLAFLEMRGGVAGDHAAAWRAMLDRPLSKILRICSGSRKISDASFHISVRERRRQGLLLKNGPSGGRLEWWWDGVRRGPAAYWDSNGELREIGQFDDGERSGRWHVYGPSGNRARVVVYEDGEAVEEEDPEEGPGDS